MIEKVGSGPEDHKKNKYKYRGNELRKVCKKITSNNLVNKLS